MHGHGEGGVGIEEAKKEIPPAAIMKVLVQVISQTEASTQEQKVGMGRNEPNRNPILSYPKTGRTWQSVLPTAAQAIELAIESLSSGKRRCGIFSIIMFFLMLIGGLHYFKNGNTGCPYIQSS